MSQKEFVECFVVSEFKLYSTETNKVVIKQISTNKINI